MHTNTDITIYNKYYDPETRLDKYSRKVIEKVFFEEKLATNRVKSGVDSSDAVMIVIPLTRLEGYVEPKEFKGSTNTFTLAIGDRVVRNNVPYEITRSPSELDKKYEAYTITSIDRKTFGSHCMQHIEIGAK